MPHQKSTAAAVAAVALLGAAPALAGHDDDGTSRGPSTTVEDVEHPELGGTLTLLLDGSEAPYLNKPDNTTFDSRGHLLIQEDPGNNSHVARIVAYDVDSGRIGVLARFDPARFAPGGARFITQDEESSGIVEAREQLGKDVFVFDAQVHAPAADPAAVEKGQLMVMRVRSWRAVFGDR